MKNVTKYILVSLVLLLFFVWVEVAKSPKGNENVTRLFFFDVGQGDAELIQKGDYQILIDGGPDNDVLVELGRVMPLTDRRIEVVILSHPHADHLAGLISVVDRYQIGRIYASGVLHSSDGYLELLQKVKDKNIELKIPQIDETITPYENAKLEFLWPGDQYSGQSVENLNNTSIVNRFCYYDECALFGGDIEIDEQAKMFEYYTNNLTLSPFKAKILKTFHHGSSNGSNNNLFEIAKPSYIVIPVGLDNKYGHPHKATLDLAEKYGAKIFRTDKDGTVEFVMAKEGVQVASRSSLTGPWALVPICSSGLPKTMI